MLHFDEFCYIFALVFGEKKTSQSEALKGNAVKIRSSARYCNIRSVRT